MSTTAPLRSGSGSIPNPRPARPAAGDGQARRLSRVGGVGVAWDLFLLGLLAFSLLVPHSSWIPLWAVTSVVLALFLWGLRISGTDRQVMAGSTLLCLIVLVPVNVMGLNARDVTVFAGTLVLLCLLMLRLRQVRLPAGTTGVIVLATVLFCSTVVWAGWVQVVVRTASVLVPMVAVFVAAGQMHMAVRTRLVDFFVRLACFYSIVAVVEVVSPGAARWLQGPDAQGIDMTNPLIPAVQRAEVTLGHPLVLSVVLLLAMGFLTSRYAWLPVAGRAAISGLLLGGVVLTGSRAAVAMAVCLFVLALVVGRRATPRVLLAFSAAIALVPFVVDSPYLRAVLDTLSGSGSVSHRLESWDAFSRLIAEQPVLRVFFGNGMAATPRLFDEGLLQASTFEVIDNQIVASLAHGGLVALVATAALLVGAVLRTDVRDLPAVAVVASQVLLFDLFTWPATTVFTVLALAWGLNPRTSLGAGSSWTSSLSAPR